MIPSALEWIDAMQEAQGARTPEAKEAAAKRLVKAELAHYEKLGLERQPRHPIFRYVIPLVLVAMICITLVLVVFFSYEANKTSDRVARLQIENVVSQRETCERTNEARVASIVEKRQSVKTLRKTVHFWRAALNAAPADEPSPLLPLFLSYVNSLQEELDTKREAIRKSIEAQAEVAVRPGSPVVDCSKATS